MIELSVSEQITIGHALRMRKADCERRIDYEFEVLASRPNERYLDRVCCNTIMLNIAELIRSKRLLTKIHA